MKVLLHSHFPAGHAYPMQAVAQALVSAGHDVTWLTAQDHQARVEASGATFVPTKQLASLDASLSQRNATGLLGDEPEHLEMRVVAAVADYRGVLDGFPANVILVDVWPHAARILHELGEIRAYATLGVIPMYTSTVTAPLPLSGKCPPQTWWATWVNAVRQFLRRWVVLPLVIRPIINKQRSILGVAGLRFGEPPEMLTYSPMLHIQASSPEMEFRLLPNLPRHHTKFVGPVITQRPEGQDALPSWWSRMLVARTVIGITQGTLAMDPTSLIIPSIRALHDYPDAFIIVISPHAELIESQVDAKDNVVYAKWVPYDALLSNLDLFITNGGYGSITQALLHGVPLLCAGQSEDKKDTAARVAWAGAGIDLKTDSPSVEHVRSAATKLLNMDGYRLRAKILGAELQDLGGASKAVQYLEELVADISDER